MDNPLDDVNDGLFPSKFTTIEASDEDKIHYKELEHLVYYMAWKSDGTDILMEAEEIVSELLEELVKGLKHYKDLHGAKKTAVLKTMLYHRMGELNHRFYGTHRRAARLSVSIDVDETADTPDPESITPEQTLVNDSESTARVKATRAKLDKTTQKVFDAVIYGNEKLETIMRLSAIRANAVFKFPAMELKCWQVAEALMLPVATVEQSFETIKQAYAKVSNGTH